MAAAREALEGEWGVARRRPSARALMLALADLMEQNADELAELESLDNGKPVGLAKVVDVRLAVEHLRYFAGWPTKIVGADDPRLRSRTCTCTRARSPWACAARSSRGTSRC